MSKRNSRYRSNRKKYKRKEEDQTTFVPMIHSKSKKMVREKAIDVILWEDAIRRQKKKKKVYKKPK